MFFILFLDIFFFFMVKQNIWKSTLNSSMNKSKADTHV